MSQASVFPVGLSELVIAKKVEQRFGLLGFARLLKLIELVVERGKAGETSLSVVVAWGDFLIALGCNQEVAGEFLAYCEHARVLDRGEDEGRLKLTLVGELAGRLLPSANVAPMPVGRVLFETDKQWCQWFKEEWSCPPYLANDPETRRLFRRWCATNVTVDEMQAAIDLAVLAREAPVPAVLHEHLKALRQTKINNA